MTLAISLLIYLAPAFVAAVALPAWGARWQPATDAAPNRPVALAVLAAALWPVLAVGALQLYSVSVLAKVAAL